MASTSELVLLQKTSFFAISLRKNRKKRTIIYRALQGWQAHLLVCSGQDKMRPSKKKKVKVAYRPEWKTISPPSKISSRTMTCTIQFRFAFLYLFVICPRVPLTNSRTEKKPRSTVTLRKIAFWVVSLGTHRPNSFQRKAPSYSEEGGSRGVRRMGYLLLNCNRLDRNSNGTGERPGRPTNFSAASKNARSRGAVTT